MGGARLPSRRRRSIPPARAHEPRAFAVASVWCYLASSENPYGYVGAEYLFEELTARLTKQLAPRLARTPGFDPGAYGFVIDHATEDEKHANLNRIWIRETVTREPAAASTIIRCFDYFRAVYPLPLWREAYLASQRDAGQGD